MILTGRWVVPISSPHIENGAIVIQDDEIVDVGPACNILEKYPHEEIRNHPTAALLPGFVNVHSHLELTVLRGYLEGLSFWDWIRRLTRTKYEILTYDEILVSALLGALEAIRAGITTVGDPMDVAASLDAALISGIRAVLYQEVFSPVPDEAETTMQNLRLKMDELRRRIADWPEDRLISDSVGRGFDLNRENQKRRRKRLRLGVSPHAPYTVSGPLFQKVQHYTKAEGLPVCIHVAESKAESQLLENGSGPIMQSFQARGIQWQPPRCSAVQYLHQLGMISDSTLLVHCIRLREPDFDILKGQRASVAHCPKSNWKLRHGFLDLKTVHQCGIRLGLGTDSVASNNNMDMIEEMRFALFNPSWLQPEATEVVEDSPSIFTAESVLRLATLGGAEALGLSSEIGSIEPGKQADVIAVDLSGMHTVPVYSPESALALSARAADVRMTMVSGDILYEDGIIPDVDEMRLLEKVEQIRVKLLNTPS